MSATVPLTIKVPPALKRELRRAARARGEKPSAAARSFLEEGIARYRPGGLLGAGRKLAVADDLDPGEPAFTPDEWQAR